MFRTQKSGGLAYHAHRFCRLLIIHHDLTLNKQIQSLPYTDCERRRHTNTPPTKANSVLTTHTNDAVWVLPNDDKETSVGFASA
jgi:hypothetical protein